MTILAETTWEPVEIHSPTYGRLAGFEYGECRTLDAEDYEAWLGLFHPEIEYIVPVRTTTLPKDGAGFDPDMTFFSEDIASLTTRIRRLQTDMAWAEQPNSRTRHFISNLAVDAAPGDERYRVTGNLLVTRTRSDLPLEFFSGERQDEIVRTTEGLRIIKRTVLLDQTVLHSYNLSIFF